VVARDLLGAWLVRQTGEGVSAGVIVETEAYGGSADLASHARAGRTRRTAPMFGPVGHAYVYLVYGMHECLNVTAHHEQPAGAVLLRALQPVTGVELMRLRRARPAERDDRLASGPARLCHAMAVDRAFDGYDLTAGEDLWLARPGMYRSPAEDDVAVGPRVGVGYAGDEWSVRPWRFWLRGNPSVSR